MTIPSLSLSLSCQSYALDFLLLKLFFCLLISSKDDKTSSLIALGKAPVLLVFNIFES